MKKIALSFVVMLVVLGLAVSPELFAQTPVTSVGGTATVTVDPVLEFTVHKIMRMSDPAATNPWTQGTEVTSFDFGPLVKVTNASNQFLYMRGTNYFVVILLVTSSGRRYYIKESAGLLTSGTNTIPAESVLLIPDYQWQDEFIWGAGASDRAYQGAMPAGAVLGPVTSATKGTGVTSTVYSSDPAGLGRYVRAIVTIGGPKAGDTWPVNYSQGYNGTVAQGTKQTEYTAWKPVTPDQPNGSYTGTITFTVTLTP